MSYVVKGPEKQVIKKIEQPTVEAQDASAMVARSQEATPKTVVAPESSENEKLKMSTNIGEEGTSAEAKLNQAQECAENRKIINSDHAGRVYSFNKAENPDIYKTHPEKSRRYTQLDKKYPDGVPFDSDGFPDFSRYAACSVEIDMKGNYTTDFADANSKAGLEEKPDDYTWHHHQDGKTMQLIPSDLHRAIMHTGGVAFKKHELV